MYAVIQNPKLQIMELMTREAGLFQVFLECEILQRDGRYLFGLVGRL